MDSSQVLVEIYANVKLVIKEGTNLAGVTPLTAFRRISWN